MPETREAYISKLEQENFELRATVGDLRRLFGFEEPVPLAFRLTFCEQKVLGMLIVREVSSRTQLLEAVLDNRGADMDRWPGEKIIDVYIHKIRRKMEPFDIQIETLWGKGYHITPENKAKIAAYRAAEQQEKAA